MNLALSERLHAASSSMLTRRFFYYLRLNSKPQMTLLGPDQARIAPSTSQLSCHVSLALPATFLLFVLRKWRQKISVMEPAKEPDAKELCRV